MATRRRPKKIDYIFQDNVDHTRAKRVDENVDSYEYHYHLDGYCDKSFKFTTHNIYGRQNKRYVTVHPN